jgi:uncharacterized protein with HEPN domain
MRDKLVHEQVVWQVTQRNLYLLQGTIANIMEEFSEN